MQKTSDYYFKLPESQIAQYPSQQRDESRLMHVDRKSGSISHYVFKDIVQFFDANDFLVLNNTRVIPARLFAEKPQTGGKVEVFLLRQLKDFTWEALIKPAKKVRSTQTLRLNDCEIELLNRNEDQGSFQIKLHYDGDIDQFIQDNGHQPLPPYIRREDEQEDKDRYQTVYAEHNGAVAAPTAGLHFTNDVLESISRKGTQILPVTLHVGLGTFRPVTSQFISDHTMHSEYYEIPAQTAESLNDNLTSNAHKVTCVGTTSVRTLESAARNGHIESKSDQTDIFITPGFEFKIVDQLITNFHTPESTLMMLVSAFAGYELIMEAYDIAVKEKYRFFSYGDSMLIT